MQQQIFEHTSQKKWALEDVMQLFDLPFNDLLFQAHSVFRQHHNPNEMQLSTLLNIKTGSCPENCSYCPQSAHYNTGLKSEPLMAKDTVVAAAKKAKDGGATRFCLGAAWRNPRDADLEKVAEMVTEIKELGMETCVTLGMLSAKQAHRLKEAGLDFYNHNIDTSPEFYKEIITTRSFEERITTLRHVQEAGMDVCCGGILGMGESTKDRAHMLWVLTTLSSPPKSVPINKLLRIPGTPLENVPPIDIIDFVKTIAVARILFPTSYVRLSAGREEMTDEAQALCFFAGVNSIFIGELLLVTPNPLPEKDRRLMESLGITPQLHNTAETACGSSGSTEIGMAVA